ncbi:L-seryl-tRNA(Sec) selenium transferase [Serratia microhaemolytica]|uniref:L-seryl-tRNA(Sec) selenium transferase n=1 Tax=Serratia microhaemolytica TaxID=2675110 RepID=UPI000FDF63EA|nr:L-seryl-tRNA(Sec) selenium transferase [Serratia microhaemolytica]
MSSQSQQLYSQLPAIDRLLRHDAITPYVTQYGQTLISDLLRQMQAEARDAIKHQEQLPAWSQDWPKELQHRLDKQQQSALRPVLNLTGTVLHTNLGRALLAQPAVDAVVQAMQCNVTLEYDLQGAGRGHRDRAVADLLCQLTGAEDACIVNNNAAAVLLMLAAVAAGQQVVVSRGELVEIGGAFRIPDVMRQAGCQLIEVGTTNRTHLADYRTAVAEQTALLMKVHTSNYRIEGFTAAVDETELAALGRELGVITATDLGSGSLIDMTQYGLPAEPMPQRLIAAGIDLVTFSGDKLLGGPQVGIIVGKKALIARLQQHPLKRALRVGKITLAALEATLRLYQQPELLQQQLPTLRQLTRAPEQMQQLAQQLQQQLEPQFGDRFVLAGEACWSQIGSGSLPADRLPSHALTFTPRDGRGATLMALTQQWHQLARPVIGRIADGKLWLDLRCLESAEQLLEALKG